MNLCFFDGNICSKPKFKFIISSKLDFKHSKHISICFFDLKIDENTIIRIKAYDDLADYCYSSFKKGDYIFASGRMNDLFEIDVDYIERTSVKNNIL